MTPFPETVSDPNIVRGRLVYQMSAALESQKRNDKRGGA